MKKALFFAATAALALSSCSSDEITYDVLKKDVKGPKAIEVNAYTPQTKAVATTLNVQNGFYACFSAPGTDNNRVSIYNGKIAYMSDATTPYYYFTSGTDASELTGNDIPTWPEDPSTVMTVYAISNGSASFTLSEDEISTLTSGKYAYTPETEAANTAQDVVVAKFSKSLIQNNNNAAILLEFNHILAKVQFNAVGAHNSTFDYKLVGLSFEGVKNDTYNLDGGEWTASETAETPTYTVFSTNASYNSMELGEEMAEVLYDGGIDFLDNSGSTAETTGKRVMYAVPGQYTVTVQYMIKLKTKEGYNKSDIITKEAVINLTGNKTNVVNMTLPATNVPISITTEVNDWDSADNTIDEDFTPKQ